MMKAAFFLRSMSTSTKLFSNKIVPRRALMYVPGDDMKKINKSFTLKADCIALDCEDGVAINRKEAARNNIKSILTDMNLQKKQICYDLGVRVNSIDSGLCQEDLKSCLSAANLPDTIFLPKVDTCDHLSWFSDEINRLLTDKQKINLSIYVESAIAFINLVDICKLALELSKKHIRFEPTSLVFGSDDFCANIGAQRTEDCSEVMYARQKLVLTAKAFNLQAIDMVYIKYKDLEGLKAQCKQGMKMGFTGKQVFHPGQVTIVQEAFLPSQRQIEWARELLDSFEKHQSQGSGAFTFRGSMIDMPTMKQAQNIVEMSKLKQ